MNAAADLPNQEPMRNSLAAYELTPSRGRSGFVEEWLLHVKRVEAHIHSRARLVMRDAPYSMGADRFRLLRMHLQALAKRQRVKVLMVTSALPREGKTTAALNLAIGLAECGGGAVALAEMDLRHPQMADLLGLEKDRGLAESLEEGSDPLASLRRVEPLGIYLLPAGAPPSNPLELLNGEGAARAVQQLRSAFEWVVVDAPPVIAVPDVLALRNLTDGCLWVMRAHATPRDLVREAMEQMGPEHILGMILNRAGELDRHLYAPYYSLQGPLLLNAGR